MRKILAGFLATSMVVSMSAMVSAAQNQVAATASFTFGSNATVVPAAVTLTGFGKLNVATAADAAETGSWSAKVKTDKVSVTLTKTVAPTSVVVNIPVNQSMSVKGTTTATNVSTPGPDELTFAASDAIAGADFAKQVNGLTQTFEIDGAVYKMTLKDAGNGKVDIDFNGFGIAGLTAVTVTPSFSISETSVKNAAGAELTTDGVPVVSAVTVAPALVAVPTTTTAGITPGNNQETIETEKDGDMTNMPVYKILKCDPDGTPIPLTEKDTGVDKNLNNSGGVQSGQTVYFMIRDDVGAAFDKLEDDSFWGMKISKSNNGKYIKSTDDVTKIFSSDLYDARELSRKIDGTGVTRHRYIKVALNEIYTDDEYKISLDVRLTAKDPAIRTGIVTKDETMLKVKDFSFWMKNIVKSADNDWTVGIQGLMLNPMLNDWNNVTYMDEVDDVAFVRFFGDSDVGKFYAKLSTKWTHDDYAAYFNDQDAFYFEFTGSPKISSTSRADLQIYDPFTDVDGNSTFDASTATIYQIVDGDLVDVTNSFTYGEGENGENAFITRTRFLGSYIICEKPVEEAVGEENIDDLMPGEEEIPVAPVTPDNNAGGKNPANTGRYA